MMTRYEGYQSRPEEMSAAVFNMTLIAIINTGLLVQIVYFDWTRGFTLPFLLSEYKEFTTQWYTQVGSTIVVTMILMVFTPHLSNCGFVCLRSCSRCCDRKCTCNEKKTKKVLQKDYEDINLGGDFDMETRYSNMLVVLTVTFIYSGGMPILYASSALFFIVTYWVDKCLLLRCYRKPIKYNNHMAGASLSFYKYICALHLISFLFMFGVTPILPTRVTFSSELDSSMMQFRTNYNEFTLYSIYFWSVLLMLVVYIVINLPLKMICGCINKCCKKQLLSEDYSKVNFSDDFFEVTNYAMLKTSLIKA